MKEETLLEQMTRVRPEVLDENALKLFNKIMEVIDERDDFHQRLIAVNKMNEDNYNKYCEALKRINRAIEYIGNKNIGAPRKTRDKAIKILGGDVDDE